VKGNASKEKKKKRGKKITEKKLIGGKCQSYGGGRGISK